MACRPDAEQNPVMEDRLRVIPKNQERAAGRFCTHISEGRMTQSEAEAKAHEI
jgi:hypothetical protein